MILLCVSSLCCPQCRWLLKEHEDVLAEQESYRQKEHELLRTLTSGGPVSPGALARLSQRSPLEEAMEDVQPDLPRNVLSDQQEAEAEGEEEEAEEGAEMGEGSGAEEREWALEELEPDLPRNVLVGQATGGRCIVTNGTANGAGGSGAAGAAAAAGAAGGGGKGAGLASRTGRRRRRESLTLAQLNARLRGSRTDLAAAVVLVAMTVWFALGLGLETRHAWLRQIWVECLLGPLG